MNSSPFTKESEEEIASSSLCIALFKVSVKKLTPVLLSAGLLQSMALSEEEAFISFNDDPLFPAREDTKPQLRKTLEGFLTEKNDFDEVVLSRYGTHTTVHKIRISGRLVEMNNGRYAYFLFTDLTPYLLHHKNERSNILNLNNEQVTIRRDLFDGLTGLPNMAHFTDLATIGRASMRGRGEPFCVLTFDFLGMKSYNLKYGMKEGDVLLKEFASLLSHTFSPLCCSRFGEDHFYAFSLTKDIEATLSRFFEEAKKLNNGNSLPVKVGIYRCKEGKDKNAFSAFDKAKFACDSDRLTYASHYIFFTDEMEKSIEMRDYVLSHLEEALEKNWIKAYYQPIFRSVSGLVCDEEALARWEDPIRGVIAPKDFIPYLEEARLLYKVDLRMIQLIIDGFDAKRKANIPLVPVSLNLSRFDFEQADMVEEVKKAMARSGYPSSLLTIEITEAVAGHDQEFIAKQIERFHEAGFKVWMDDFGAGYSSLNVLSDLSFDLVKIDMKFMRGFLKNEKVAPLLSSILQMAQALGIDTLCEGVETKEQLTFLANNGCDRIQGFYYEKPIPLSKVLDRTSKWARENPLDTPYYNEVGMACLESPQGVEEKLGARAGVLEYQAGKCYFLRGTAAYREFLEKAGMVNFSSFTKTRLPFTKAPIPSFINAVERAIASGNKVTFPFLLKGMPAYRITVKEIARKGVSSPCYALLIVLEPSNEEYLSEETLFPTLTVKMVYDSNGNPKDLLFLDCNKKHEEWSAQKKEKIVGNTLFGVYKNASSRWLGICKEAQKQNKEINGEVYSKEVGKNLIYSLTPLPEKDTFLYRFFEIDGAELLNAYVRHDVGADSLLFKASKTLAKNHSKHNVGRFLEDLSHGLECRFALYKKGKAASSLLSYAPSLGKAPSFYARPELYESFASQIEEKGIYDSAESKNSAKGFSSCSRFLAVPVIKDGVTVGYLAALDYCLDKKEDTEACLLEGAELLSNYVDERNAAKAKRKEEGKSNRNKKKRLKLFDLIPASSAEQDCLDNFNMGYLFFGAPFYGIAIALFGIFGMSLSSSSLPDVSLLDINEYFLPRLLTIIIYAVLSFACMGFAFYARKKNNLFGHRSIHAVMLSYMGLTCFVGAFLSWQDFELGVFNFTYALSMIYLFACYRIRPWKGIIYILAGACALTLAIAFAPCLPSPYYDSLNHRLSGVYFVAMIGIALISFFLNELLYWHSLKMLRLSTVDQLTQLRNRFALDLDKRRAYGVPCILLLMDIDDFKHWNDTYGHDKGDRLLILFASLLRKTFGEDAVYRYGGDEFVILSYDDRHEFEKKIASFKEEMKKEMTFGLDTVSFSGGYREVLFDDDASFLSAVSLCDALLYEGKKSGKALIIGK